MGKERGSSSQVVVRNEAGDLEVIDLDTGEVVANSRVAPTTYSFDYSKALLICQLVRSGKTWAEIALEPDMPPLEVISHWQRGDRMFAEELKIARGERAEFYHDQAMTIAKLASERKIHKDDVPGATLAVKTYQWAAERAKPESYGNKVTHEGSTEKPILMRVVNTGINRAKPDVPVAPFIEVPHEQAGTEEARHRGSDTRDYGEDKKGEGKSDQ